MTYTVNLDRKVSTRLQSSVDSSTVSIPGGTCTDLTNCPGSFTHIAGRYSYTLNVRENCIPKGVGLQASTKGLVLIGAPDASLYEYTDSLIDTNVLKILQYAAGAINSNGTINNAVFANKSLVQTALGASASDTNVEIIGADINVYSAGSFPRLIATMQRPEVSLLVDQCDTAVGFTIKVATTVQGYDQATCKPRLVWQNSTKLSFNQSLYAQDFQTATTQAVLVTKLREILQAGSGVGEDICDNVGPNMETIWASLQNQPLLIGTADG